MFRCRLAPPTVQLMTALSSFPFAEIVRAMTHVINQGMAMYWGTSRWSAMEIMVIDCKICHEDK